MVEKRKKEKTLESPQDCDVKLSPEELKALKKKAEEFKKAQKQVTDAIAVMWNTRLDVAIASGKSDEIDLALKQPPIALWDDCDCNSKDCGMEPIITTPRGGGGDTNILC